MNSSSRARRDTDKDVKDGRNSHLSGNRENEQCDVAVIGGGQAGLAIGYFLARQGRRFVILEASDAIGSAWRERWDSLLLFTPRRYDSLPGFDFVGDPDGYPTRDEVIAYLDEYATKFSLPVKYNSTAKSLTSSNDEFVVEHENGRVEADQVVVATGPFQKPHVPDIAKGLQSDVFQSHSADYRRPSDVPEGRVVIVGGGNTGYQIAKELSVTRPVSLAVGSKQTPLPQKLLGRDIFWWLTKLGLLKKNVDSRLGRKAKDRDTLIGSSARELRRRYGVELKPRVVTTSGRTLTFSDDSTLDVDAVIWATGYRSDYSWIDLPVLEDATKPRHRRGETDVPGLYFIGLPWQYTRGSALLGWVKDDAEFIAKQIDAYGKVLRATEEISAPTDDAASQPAARTTQGV